MSRRALQSLSAVLILFCAACGPSQQAAPTPPPRALAPGPYHVISVAALTLTDRDNVSFRISNDGDFPACLLATSVPTPAFAGAIRVFRANGAERRNLNGPVNAADAEDVTRLDPGAHLDVSTRLHGLRNGECVMFQPVYEPCARVIGNRVDPTLGLSVDAIGIAQGTWIVRDGALTKIAQDDPSCRATSDPPVR